MGKSSALCSRGAAAYSEIPGEEERMQPRYELWDLGPSFRYEPHLNNADTAVFKGGGLTGVGWSKGATFSIDPLPGAGGISPFAINDNGLVVGFAPSNDAPFMWDRASGATDLSGQFRSTSGSALDVNSNNVIVGCSNFGKQGHGGVPIPPIYPCIYDLASDNLTDLRAATGNDGQGIVTRINEAGQAVGSQTAAFLYDNGAVTDISHGYPGLDAVDINNNGQILVQLSGGALIHEIATGTLTPLSITAGDAVPRVVPRAINDDGTVVGYFVAGSSGRDSACIYPAQDSTNDLNDLIDPNSGWHLSVASDINHAGHIAGLARTRTGWRLFILTPPGTHLIPPSFVHHLRLMDQVIYGVIQDGGGLTAHHGPIGPWNEDRLLADAEQLERTAASLTEVIPDLADRANQKEVEAHIQALRELAERTRELASHLRQN
jgi:uncharacterized membrane protein